MQESSAAGGVLMAKAISSPAIAGAFAGAVGFMFWWPTTKREGFSRLAASAICSHLFGDAWLRTIIHFASWIPLDEMRMGAYMMAGLPGWFILGAVIRYFKNNQTKDAAELTSSVIETAKRVKDAL